MKKLIAALGLVSLLGCAHLPKVKPEQDQTYFVTESFCDGEKITDYKIAERLREKYPHSQLIVLSPHETSSEIAPNYHGEATILSGFYDGKRIDRDVMLAKVSSIIPPHSLVFFMSHGNPKLGSPNLEVCPWDGWQEVRIMSGEAEDEKIKKDGTYLTAEDLPNRTVYPLNCSAHPKYMMGTELDQVVSGILESGLAAVYEDKKIKDQYLTEDREFLQTIPH